MKCRILIITTLLSFVTVVGMAQPNPNNLEWMQHIRTDHPRLFLTGEDIPQIKFTATSFEEPYFAMLKRRIGKIIDQ